MNISFIQTVTMDLPVPSPFAEHLQTNYCPSDSELGEIRKLLDAPHPEIPALDAEIARVSEQLKQLQSKRNGYDQYLATHRSLLSPIRRLPLEILHNIFYYTLPTDHNCLMSPLEAPMLLTHVCRHWRELVHGMPLLWSSLYIPIPNYPTVASCIAGMGYTRANREGVQLTAEQKEVVEEVFATWDRKIAQRKETVKKWLERAEGSNLFITLLQWDARREPGPSHTGAGANIDSATREAVRGIVSLIKSYSKQWKRLEISASRSIVEELVSLPAEGVPNLEFLRVSSRPVFVVPTPAMLGHLGVHPNMNALGAHDEDSLDTLYPSCSVITSPNLKALSLRVIQQDITKVPVQWENLTGFFFYGYAQHGPPTSVPLSFTPSQALDLLARCPNLKRCGLAVGSLSSWAMPGPPGSTASTDVLDESRHVVLAHLERLFIQEQPTFPLAQFFQCLEMPKLSSLAFSTTIAPTKPLERPDEDFLTPSNAGIHVHGGGGAHPPPHLIGMHHHHVFHPPGAAGTATPPPPESSLVVLLRNCGHTIKRLEFDYHSQTQANLRECLQLAENVERLSLNVVSNPAGGLGSRPGMYYINDRGREHAPAYMGNTFFRELIPKLGGDAKDEAKGDTDMEFINTISKDPGCLCPKLTSFSVRLMTAELSEDALLEFVRARRHSKAMEMGVARLKKAKVIFALEKKKTRKAAAAAGDEKDNTVKGSESGEPRSTDGDNITPSLASLLKRRLKMKPRPWDLLDTLKGQEDVDLEGLEAEVSWPRSDGRGIMMLAGRMSNDGMWSPSWGLVEEGELSDSPVLFPISVGYMI